MDKKVGALLLTTLVMSLFLVNFVAAQSNPLLDIINNMDEIIENIVSFIEPIASQLVGDAPSGELLFAKVLFLIIIFAIIWVALSRIDFFTEYTWVLVVISIAASILGTRFLASDALVDTIILPYSTLGIAISAGLPFVLYFLIINIGMSDQRYKLIRKIAWIFFAVIFTGLWISRYDEILAQGSNAGWIYPLTATISLAMVFFDGTIRKWLKGIEIDRIGAGSAQDAIDEVKRKILELPDMVNDGVITQQEADKRKKEYRKRLKHLMKY